MSDPDEAQRIRTSAPRATALQRTLFATSLAVASRIIHLRDLLRGRIPRRVVPPPGLELTPLSIRSGSNLLDAVYAAPLSQPARATVLICHGIGEIAVQWLPVQHLLAARGVASLVFDYSGYGRSTGWPTPEQCEQDAVAAFRRLGELRPGPLSLLGFSLGTGIVPAILDRVDAHRLVICEGFTSFRAAARRVGFLPPLSALVPPVWASENALRACSLPVLLVHSTRDRLFPVTMAETLAGWCGPRAQLQIVEGLRHNEPFYNPTPDYWYPIADFLAAQDPSTQRHVSSWYAPKFAS
jgi:alpha-beta hydrolase superfamily lysophospholipase